MTWVRLDDGYPENLKVVGLSDAAFRADVEAWCYAARNLTDGFVPEQVARRWRSRAVSELLGAGRWHEAAGGYLIHDYLDYNPSRLQVNEERSKKQAAGRAGGLARASRLLQEKLNPDPTRPDPTPNAEGNALRAVVDNRPDEDQVYLAGRLAETWDQELGIPALQKLNSKHGRPAVTSALRQLHGFPPDNAIKSLYAYIESIAAQEVA